MANARCVMGVINNYRDPTSNGQHKIAQILGVSGGIRRTVLNLDIPRVHKVVYCTFLQNTIVILPGNDGSIHL